MQRATNERRSQFLRVGERSGRSIRISLDGDAIAAIEGESLLAALLTARGWVRQHEFGGTRAGFCLMGVCQDCWVQIADLRRLRACTTPAEDGMAVLSGSAAKDPPT